MKSAEDRRKEYAINAARIEAERLERLAHDANESIDAIMRYFDNNPDSRLCILAVESIILGNKCVELLKQAGYAASYDPYDNRISVEF